MEDKRIKPIGYEYRGWKLGEKVMYEGLECTIVGFDEDAPHWFMLLGCKDDSLNCTINSDDFSISSMLEDFEIHFKSRKWINTMKASKIENQPSQNNSNKNQLITKVVQSDDKKTTVFFFNDGTKTKVKLNDGDEYCPYVATAMAISKYTLGGYTGLKEIVEEFFDSDDNLKEELRKESVMFKVAEMIGTEKETLYKIIPMGDERYAIEAVKGYYTNYYWTFKEIEESFKSGEWIRV